MPALHDIPAPVTRIDFFDFDICVDKVERRCRCSGLGFSRDTCTVILNLHCPPQRSVYNRLRLIDVNVYRGKGIIHRMRRMD